MVHTLDQNIYVIVNFLILLNSYYAGEMVFNLIKTKVLKLLFVVRLTNILKTTFVSLNLHYMASCVSFINVKRTFSVDSRYLQNYLWSISISQ